MGGSSSLSSSSLSHSGSDISDGATECCLLSNTESESDVGLTKGDGVSHRADGMDIDSLENEKLDEGRSSCSLELKPDLGVRRGLSLISAGRSSRSNDFERFFGLRKGALIDFGHSSTLNEFARDLGVRTSFEVTLPFDDEDWRSRDTFNSSRVIILEILFNVKFLVDDDDAESVDAVWLIAFD